MGQGWQRIGRQNLYWCCTDCQHQQRGFVDENSGGLIRLSVVHFVQFGYGGSCVL